MERKNQTSGIDRLRKGKSRLGTIQEYESDRHEKERGGEGSKRGWKEDHAPCVCHEIIVKVCEKLKSSRIF